MREPAVPAEHRLRILQDHIALFFQSPVDSLCQPSGFQKIAGTDAGGGCRECVPDNIHLLRSRFDLHPAFFIRWQQLPDLADLPGVFYLDAQLLPAVLHDLLHCLLQI